VKSDKKSNFKQLFKLFTIIQPNSYFRVSNHTIISLAIGFVGCRAEQDDTWSINWPITVAGETATQKCPGGSEVAGMD